MYLQVESIHECVGYVGKDVEPVGERNSLADAAFHNAKQLILSNGEDSPWVTIDVKHNQQVEEIEESNHTLSQTKQKRVRVLVNMKE